MRTLLDLQSHLPLSPDNGLSAEAVAKSRQQFGANRLTPLPREPLWQKFLEKFDEPIIKILLAAALLSIVVDLFHYSAGLGSGAIVVVALAVGTAFALKQGRWVPSLLFGLAVLLFLVSLAVQHPSVEGLAVMVAVVLATGVAFASEYKSDREFEILNAQKESLRAKVLRGGEFQTLVLEEVVAGDTVLLEMGDEIPADGRLVKATDLYVDQSLMTGESEPVHKKARPLDDTADGPDQPGCLYRGTQIVDGVGELIVTEVGDATYLGQIARRLSAEEAEDDEAIDPSQQRVKHKLTISKELTPLQLKLQNLAGLISNVGYVAAVAIFLALLVRGLIVGEVRWPGPGEAAGPVLLASARALLSYFVYMVIIIVVAVPEGLPMSVTVSLALAMQKMTRANSLVRQLVACETIGSATVICSDKTGTLTQNRMQVVRLSYDGQVFDRSTDQWPVQTAACRSQVQNSPSAIHHPLGWIALNAAVNSTANLEEKNGKRVIVGNTTEGALLQWLHEADLEYLKLRLQFEPLYQIHFSSERKRMTSVVRADGKLVALVKGAPEWLLEQATHYQAADGTIRAWTPEARQQVEAAIRDSSAQAMRTLAFGYVPLPPETPTDEDALHGRRDTLERGLVFVGFVAIRDPVRDDVKEAIARCRDAGIEVKMITGDNVETARAIAYEIGLIDRRDAAIDTPDAVVYTSPYFSQLFKAWNELRKLPEPPPEDRQHLQHLSDRIAGMKVLARAKPLDKYNMVEVLQSRQEVVAMTGDGTNDAPALKKADVGLAMGIAGTEVAKEASKIVLLDDAFSTIVKAVHWGRSLYENIQRFIQFQLTINVSALTIAFLGPFVGVKPPFTVLQLLWINVIMDTFASIALCSEPPRSGVMVQRPKRKDENILTPMMIQTIFTTAAFFVVVMLALLLGMEYARWFAGTGPRSEAFPELTVRQVSIFFTVYVFFQVWNQINCRSLVPQTSGWHRLFDNWTFLTIAGTVALVQVLIINVPFLAAVFKVEPLGWLDWLWILVGTASVLIFAEAARWLRLQDVG